MKKETLTVQTDKWGTVYRFNAAGELHNAHGPAVVWANGGKEYWIDGKQHNDNGPARIWHNGGKEYWIDGKRHNDNGPAAVWANGSKAYYINGKRLTESEFKSWRAQQAAPLHGKIATIDGIEYTLIAKS